MNRDLEDRIAELEARLTRYEEAFADFMTGPGRKIARMLGFTLPEDICPPRQ